MDDVLNFDRITKRVTITTVKGIRLKGLEPVEFTAHMHGSWKEKSAERWLRRKLKDPTITVAETESTSHTYSIPTETFFANAEQIDD